MIFIYSVRDLHQENREKIQQGASLYQPAWEQVAMLELVTSTFLELPLLMCTFLISCGSSVLLVNYILARTVSKASCRSDLFSIWGQRMVPCSWPETRNNHFLSHGVTTGLLQWQAKDSSNSALVKTGSGTIRLAPQAVILRPWEGELPSMYVSALLGLMQLQCLCSTLFVLWQNRRKYIAKP